MRLALMGGLLAVVALSAGCGDDGGDSDADDPRRGEIGGVAELAIGAYASVGAEALVDYMSQDALDRCPQDQLAAALSEQPVPTGFKQLADVDFNGDTVTATITISTRDGERDITWMYVDEGGHWRIDEMPGLEDCA